MRVKLKIELTIKLDKKDWAELYYDNEVDEVTPEAVVDDLTHPENHFGEDLATELEGMTLGWSKDFEIVKAKVLREKA